MAWGLSAGGSLSLEEVTILMDPGKDEMLMQIEVDEIMAVSGGLTQGLGFRV